MNHLRLKVGDLRRPVVVDAEFDPVAVVCGVDTIAKMATRFGFVIE
jgi:hypothetical protein